MSLESDMIAEIGGRCREVELSISDALGNCLSRWATLKISKIGYNSIIC